MVRASCHRWSSLMGSSGPWTPPCWTSCRRCSPWRWRTQSTCPSPACWVLPRHVPHHSLRGCLLPWEAPFSALAPESAVGPKQWVLRASRMGESKGIWPQTPTPKVIHKQGLSSSQQERPRSWPVVSLGKAGESGRWTGGPQELARGKEWPPVYEASPLGPARCCADRFSVSSPWRGQTALWLHLLSSCH